MSRNPNTTAATKDIRYGHKVVGATAVRLTAFSAEMRKGVLLRAPGDLDPTPNTHTIWIGTNESVTADSDVETGGMPLVPGAAITVPAKDANGIWVIAGAASQDIAWIGV
jgi:hypothetical protein